MRFSGVLLRRALAYASLQFVISSAALLPFVESSSSNFTDQEALLGLKSLITTDPSEALTSWRREGSSVCAWSHVLCDRNNRVSVLDLHGLNLAGQISPQIGNLSALRSLYLQNNRLYGMLPSQFGRLARLQVLNASANLLSGPIPSELTNCSNLETVDLSANALSGVMPSSIHLLSKLQILKLGQNQLYGAIPPSISNLSALTALDVGTNNLTGAIPLELGHLNRLRLLQLSINNLTGTVPDSLYNVSTLTTFALASNDLHGEIPGDVGLRLPNLLVFHFCFNKFTGPIPHSLHNVTKIQSLRMSHNFLTGAVPRGLGHLPDLVMYNIGFNLIADSVNFLDALVNSTMLQFLAIDENLLVGTLPESIGDLSSSLAKLYMGGNNISGQIPPSIGRLASLTLLNMSHNQLSGQIPEEIGQLKALNMLGLAENQLSGPIPAALGDLTALMKLEMNGNKLQSGIPAELGRLQRVLSLDLSSNNLNGSMPGLLFALTSLTSLLNLSHNSLTGTLPQEIGQLQNIVAIDLSHNFLDGSIPTSVGDCRSLQTLSLSSNALSGAIPSTAGNLKGLQSLDLSANQLSSGIPESLEKLQALQLLNLSFNNLNGWVPSGGIFKNHSVVLLDGNPNLCNSVSSCFHSHASHRRKMAIAASTAAAATAILLLLSLTALFLSRRSSGNAKAGTTDIPIKGQHPVVSYGELSLVTNRFDERNLIGVGSFGSVYKAILRNGMPVAIKVLDLRKTGASKSYTAECEALRTVRHRNLVGLVTVCSSTDFAGNDFRALVYEFMSNGSLEDWIRGRRQHENGAGLGAIERLFVAIDVASALEYLHSECGGQVVHCDIKPSNVLLDGDMTTKVGDFGLARLLAPRPPGQGSISSTHGLKGSIGYIPPEYGFGARPSTKGDVYSYGVMLLELITGTSPIDQSFGGDLSLEKWVRAAFPHHASELVDVQLIHTNEDVYYEGKHIATEQLLECLVSMIKVALSCTAESPDERISMHDALLQIMRIKEAILKRHNSTNHT